jgi:hypothetical protein
MPRPVDAGLPFDDGTVGFGGASVDEPNPLEAEGAAAPSPPGATTAPTSLGPAGAIFRSAMAAEDGEDLSLLREGETNNNVRFDTNHPLLLL